MITMLTAHTEQIDEPDLAVEEILAQLRPAETLLAHSVGIVSCFADYVETEVVSALSDALSFPIVGTTTIANAVPGAVGNMLLTLTVLTSDGVQFSCGLSDAITAEDIAPIQNGYARASEGYADSPALMLVFAPLLMNVGGDFYIESLTKVSGGVPAFGTIVCDHHNDYHAAQVLHGGMAYYDRMAYVLLYGDIQPAFMIANLSDEKVFPEKGIVTAAKGNQLQTVNGVPVLEYLRSLGMSSNENGVLEGVNAFPFIVDYNDGTVPVVRVMFHITEEGYAVCGGDIPVGATLSVGSIDAGQVLSTTATTLRGMESAGKKDCVLMFSCIGRYFALDYDPMAESRAVSEHPWGDVPFSLSYSGGELCPVYNADGNVSNRNHNDTFIVCML